MFTFYSSWKIANIGTVNCTRERVSHVHNIISVKVSMGDKDLTIPITNISYTGVLTFHKIKKIWDPLSMFRRKWDIADVRAECEYNPVKSGLDRWPAEEIFTGEQVFYSYLILCVFISENEVAYSRFTQDTTGSIIFRNHFLYRLN